MAYKIIFAGAVQNADNYLPAVLKNLENISQLASDTGFIFVENDSLDNTKKILTDWGRSKSNFYLINLDGLKVVPIRGLRLELIRNAYVETIKTYDSLRKFDFLIVLDTDDVGVYPIDLDHISEAINFLNASPSRAAVFANQKGTYYDMWTLRHNHMCPGDIWEEVLDYVIKNQCSDESAFAQTFAKRIFSIEESQDPIKVDSAFGGFGIYKMEYVLNNPNPYIGSKTKIVPLDDGTPRYARWQVCEHVHFHSGIKSQGGEMFIYPKLINGVNSGISFPPSAFRWMLF